MALSFSHAPKQQAIHLSANDRCDVRLAAQLAVQNWPNAHLGELTPRQDLRSAFYLMRRYVERGDSVHQAACEIERDAYRHADM